MDAWIRRLDSFWFAPTAPTNLGVCRIVFYALVWKRYLHLDFGAWARAPADFWQPIWPHVLLPREAFAPELVDDVQIVWKGLLLLCALGLFSRVTTVLAFVGGYYLIGLYQCFGKTTHFDAPVLIILGVLAVSRCGDSWSVDRWIRARRHRGPAAESGSAMSGEYNWPIRFAQVLLTLVFFGAGVTKLRRSGFDWIYSDNMKHILQSHHYTHEVSTRWGLYLADFDWIPRLLAFATIALEVGAPLALLGVTLRRIFIPGLAAMQIGIQVLTGAFAPYWLLYQFWVPWDRVIDGTRRWFARLRRQEGAGHGV